jgi:general secretion pathway protein D
MSIRIFLLSISTLMVVQQPVRAAEIIPKGEAEPVPQAEPVADFKEVRRKTRCLEVPADKRVRVSLKPETELKDLVAWISALTCRTIIVPRGLRSQPVTLFSPSSMTAGEAYRIFLSALDATGLSLVKTGKRTKIVRADGIVRSPVAVRSHRDRHKLPRDDRPVTQFIRPHHAEAQQLLPILLKMKSRTADVTHYAPTNALIITDTAANVRRLVRIIDELDEELDEEKKSRKIRVIRLAHMDPATAQQTLTQLFATSKGRGPRSTKNKKNSGADLPPTIVADAHSNSLIIVSGDEVWGEIRELLAKVDIAEGGNKPRLWNYRLRHGQAEQVAQAIAQVNVSPKGRRNRAKQPTGLFEQNVKISADKANNALLIVATLADYLDLRNLIREMDRPKKQVFIEAFILEVKLDKNRDLGVGFHGGGGVGSSMILGGLNHGAELNSAILNPISLMGMAAGVQGPPIPGSGAAMGLNKDIPSFGVVIHALQKNSDIDILSSPHILTSDNTEAEIMVGDTIPIRGGAPPIPSGQNQQLSFLSAYQPVDRKEVGLKLKLTPTIGDGDTVRLKLSQEVSNVKEINFGDGDLGASTSKRLIQSTVVVADQQAVVIGGLVTERTVEVESKVPFLGDIPIIGALFTRKGKRVEKKNLLVLLTPYIIRDRSDMYRIYQRKMEERREFIRLYTEFQERSGLHDIDYRYKHGLLAEIAHEARRAKKDAMEEQAAKRSSAR